MNGPMILTFVILTLTILVFILDVFRVDVVALLALLALVLTGLITSEQALAGFANSTVVTIAGLFVVGGALFRTGVADWLGDQLLRLAGSSEARLLIVLMLGTAALSGFLSNTGTVAVLLPAVVAAAWRIRSAPSRLLLPMAFAAQVGGLLTLIGTPPNIVVTNTLRSAGQRPFGFFEFSLIGLPLVAVVTAYMLVAGRRWLPHREMEGRAEPALSAGELADAYQLEKSLFRLRARRGSPLAGKTLAESRLGRDYGVTVLRVERAGEGRERASRLPLEGLTDSFGRRREQAADVLAPGAETVIYADDVMLVEGTPTAVEQAVVRFNLGIQPADSSGDPLKEDLLPREVGLAEVLITPRSALIGHTLTEANFGDKYNVRVLGIWRRGKPLDNVPLTGVKLAFGDALLVRGTWKAIGIMEREARNFVVVGRPAAMHRPGGLSPQAIVALLSMLLMMVLLLTGWTPTVIAVLIAGMVMVLGGALTMEEAYRAVHWESIILIAAMLPMSTALETTGGAAFIARGLVYSLGSLHPLLLLAGIFLLTTALTQVISNTATTVLAAPIALQAALNLGVSPHALLMMVAVGASTAFLTPIASPVNMLVLTPGGYRFNDFMKSGLPLLLLFLLVSVLILPLVWPL